MFVWKWGKLKDLGGSESHNNEIQRPSHPSRQNSKQDAIADAIPHEAERERPKEKQHNERFIHNKRTRKKTNANIKKKMILVDRQAISAEIQPNIRAMAASANTGNPPSPPVTPQNKKTVRKEHSLLVRSQRSLSIATQDEDGCISALTFCLAPFANLPTLFPHYHSAMEDDSSFIGSER